VEQCGAKGCGYPPVATCTVCNVGKCGLHFIWEKYERRRRYLPSWDFPYTRHEVGDAIDGWLSKFGDPACVECLDVRFRQIEPQLEQIRRRCEEEDRAKKAADDAQAARDALTIGSHLQAFLCSTEAKGSGQWSLRGRSWQLPDRHGWITNTVRGDDQRDPHTFRESLRSDGTIRSGRGFNYAPRAEHAEVLRKLYKRTGFKPPK
jgi:hypothetical protein